MVVDKRYIDFNETKGLVGSIIHGMQKIDWRPDTVIGITRGGLLPAVMVSQYYDCKMLTLDYSLRDRDDAQSFDATETEAVTTAELTGNVLIIDDINDSGETLAAIKSFIDDTLMFPKNFRYAALLEKGTSKFDCDFWGELLMDEAGNDWIVFPYEEWWTNRA